MQGILSIYKVPSFQGATFLFSKNFQFNGLNQSFGWFPINVTGSPGKQQKFLLEKHHLLQKTMNLFFLKDIFHYSQLSLSADTSREFPVSTLLGWILHFHPDIVCLVETWQSPIFQNISSSSSRFCALSDNPSSFKNPQKPPFVLLPSVRDHI